MKVDEGVEVSSKYPWPQLQMALIGQYHVLAAMFSDTHWTRDTTADLSALQNRTVFWF